MEVTVPNLQLPQLRVARQHSVFTVRVEDYFFDLGRSRLGRVATLKTKTCRSGSESMPAKSYSWTSSWYRNMQRIAGFADAVTLVCDITPEQHKYMLSRRAMRIESQALHDALVEHGSNLGDVLDWIADGIKQHNKCERVPESFVLREPDLTAHKSAWTRHITDSKQSLSELKRDVEAILADLSEKRKKFDADDTGGYSSYSDYSEDETDSEQEEGDVDDGLDDEETMLQRRRRPPGEERDKRRNRDNK